MRSLFSPKRGQMSVYGRASNHPAALGNSLHIYCTASTNLRSSGHSLGCKAPSEIHSRASLDSFPTRSWTVFLSLARRQGRRIRARLEEVSQARSFACPDCFARELFQQAVSAPRSTTSCAGGCGDRAEGPAVVLVAALSWASGGVGPAERQARKSQALAKRNLPVVE